MLVDAEHCFDPYYSKALGVDVERLIVCQLDNGEMALESNYPLPKTCALHMWCEHLVCSPVVVKEVTGVLKQNCCVLFSSHKITYVESLLG